MDYDLKIGDRVVATVDSVDADAAAGKEVSGSAVVSGSHVTVNDDDSIDRKPVTVLIQPVK